MELREYLAIFRKQQKSFTITVIIFLALGLAFYIWQPVLFENNLMLNVSRKGTQQTSDYRYDDFYRLQADERFADTVVRWLGSPQLSARILKDAGVEKYESDGVFKSQRLSSQMIQVTFKTKSSEAGEKIALSVSKIVNMQTEDLNKDQNEETWFKMISSENSISLSNISLSVIFLATLMLGVFTGVWVVMIRHYFSK